MAEYLRDPVPDGAHITEAEAIFFSRPEIAKRGNKQEKSRSVPVTSRVTGCSSPESTPKDTKTRER